MEEEEKKSILILIDIAQYTKGKPFWQNNIMSDLSMI